jgi:iron complex transport system permease protein
VSAAVAPPRRLEHPAPPAGPAAPAGWPALALLTLLLVASLVLAAGVGAVAIAPGQTVAILLGRIGIALPVPFSALQETVLLAIRLPRVLLAALVGAGLAVSGATLQGVFRNPLADPGLIGVSGGAALGAVAAIVAGWRPLGLATLPLAAFAGGLAATLAVYRLARYGGRR